MAIALGVRQLFQPGSQHTLVVSGVFDAFSAGILFHTGLVQLLAYDFSTLLLLACYDTALV